MKSPFKFLKRYTREDREIIFGWLHEITELIIINSSLKNDITPLQSSSKETPWQWVLPTADILWDFSAINIKPCSKWTKYISTGHNQVNIKKYQIIALKALPAGRQWQEIYAWDTVLHK
jgi:hypothetical protein